MTGTLLVLNAGSSSIKFQVFGLGVSDALVRQMKGRIEGVGTAPRLIVKGQDGGLLVDESWPAKAVADVPSALDRVLTWLVRELGGTLPAAIGHRVAHGGPAFSEPVVVDDHVLEQLEGLVPLAPLHQPNNLAPIRAIRERRPELLQVACFDTAFHHGHAEVAQRYAVPDALFREGVRRYGFHGLSYEYIASMLPGMAPEIADGRVVVAHLGSGASLCALRAGRSVDSTMGFTALDGLPMGTRSGQVDPGVLLYLLESKAWSAKRVEKFLYHDCGLKGLSGVSNDMRDLLASDASLAGVAVDYFVYRILLETGALAAAMEGLDGIVFTAGIGENAPEIRHRVCRGLAWLGLALDDAANRRNGLRISKSESKVSAWVVPTDEEQMIALHTLEARRKLAMA
jgi:acetate kinase